MKRYFAINLFLLFTHVAMTQIIYSEDFDGVETWTLNELAWVPEGSSPNQWYISCEEEGGGAGACSEPCSAGNKTLHISPNPFLSPDIGATYLETGTGATTTDRLAISPPINTVGEVTLILTFDILVGGPWLANDFCNVIYSYDGGIEWYILDFHLFGFCCDDLMCSDASALGKWNTKKLWLPDECAGIPNLMIGFEWHNIDEGEILNPSVAIDNITISAQNTLGSPVAKYYPTKDTSVCAHPASFIYYIDNSFTTDALSSWIWTFDGGIPSSATGPGPHAVNYISPGIFLTSLEVTDGLGTDIRTTLVQVIPSADAGSDATHEFCSGDAPADLFLDLSGASPFGVWSPVLSSGYGIFDPAIDPPAIYTYMAYGCPFPEYAVVTVLVNSPPDAGSDGTVNFCSTDDVFDLTTLLSPADPGGTWSPAMSSGTGEFDPSLDPAGSYFYIVDGGGCADDTALVTVEVEEFLTAGADSVYKTCETSGTINLNDLLDEDAAPGGAWTDDDATGTLTGTIFDFSFVASPGIYDFTYQLDNTPPCADDEATITVQMLDCTGITEFQNSQLTVFPNPASTILRITSSGDLISKISVFTPDGKVLGCYSEAVIDVHLLPAGIYFIRCEIGQRIQYSSFEKQ